MMGWHTVLSLASGAMAQLAVQRLFPAQLILDFATVASSLVASLEVLVRLVELVRRLGLPVVQTRLLLLLVLFGRHRCVTSRGSSGRLVGAVWRNWSRESSGGDVCVLGRGAIAVA
jgi:hypothetical protein